MTHLKLKWNDPALELKLSARDFPPGLREHIHAADKTKPLLVYACITNPPDDWPEANLELELVPEDVDLPTDNR